MRTVAVADPLVIDGVELRSRLFLGTGKYPDDESMLAALEASGCELVTVALRRLDLDDPKKKTILDVIEHKSPPLWVSGTLDAYLFNALRRLLPSGLYHRLLYAGLPRIWRWGQHVNPAAGPLSSMPPARRPQRDPK